MRGQTFYIKLIFKNFWKLLKFRKKLTRVKDSFDTGVWLEKLGNGHAILAVALHSHVERLQTAIDQVTVESGGDGANGVLDEEEFLLQCIAFDDDEAHDDVRVAVHVLGRRVHHHVGAEVERALVVRRQEGVVDDDDDVLVVVVDKWRDLFWKRLKREKIYKN